MCPALPNARHVLINPIAADALRERKGIDGTVIPDGFDFDREVLPIDEVAFRARLDVVTGDPRPLARTTWWWRCRRASPSTSRSSSPSSWSPPSTGARGLLGAPTGSATTAGVSPRPAASCCCCPRARISTTTARTSTGLLPTRSTCGSPWHMAATSSSPTAATCRRRRALSVLQHLPGGGPGLLSARARRLWQPGHRGGVGAAASGGLRVPGVPALCARSHPQLHLSR